MNTARKAGALILSLLVILLDQLSKWGVSEHILRPLSDGTSKISYGFAQWYADPPQLLPFAEFKICAYFSLVMVWNRGISFGMLSGDHDYSVLILTVVALLICAFFLFWLSRTNEKIPLLGIALVVGGALGNVIDRLRFGAVIDFLDFHIGEWHYPAFNVADSCICVGVAILVFHGLFLDKKSTPTT